MGVAGRLRDKAWIWADADAVDTNDEREAAAAEAEESCDGRPERRDSTSPRRASHSSAVHPSRLRRSSLGHTQGWATGGEERF